MKKVHLLLSPVPAKGSREYRKWQKQLNTIQQPGIFRRSGRKVRNAFNILRDAFAKALSMLVGAAKSKTAVGKIPAAGKGVDDVGIAVLESVSNSYEPLLEERLGKILGVKVKNVDQMIPVAGTIQEYNDQYLLLRGVTINADHVRAFLPDGSVVAEAYDVIISRQIGVARFLLKPRPGK